MKNGIYKIIYIMFAITIIVGFNLILYIKTGKLDKEPVVEVNADNCYDQTLVVITDSDYSPYSFVDNFGNNSGFDVELITIIANRMNMNLDLRMMTWEEGIDEIINGDADILMTCGYDDNFGDGEIIMTEPVSVDSFAVYSKYKISSIDSLYGKKIAIMEDGNAVSIVEMLKLSDYCIEYEDNTKAMQALEDGEVDFAIMREKIGDVIIRRLGFLNIKSYTDVGQSFMCFALKQEDKELVDEINNTIEELKTEGEIERLNEKWLTTFVSPYSFREVLEQNIWVAFVIALFIVFSLVLLYRSKSTEIKERSKQVDTECELKERLEEALEFAKNASESKTEFLFNMSHDIRTPMNAILGYTDKGLQHSDDEEVTKDCFKKIKIAGGHLLNLINDILEMSRIESGNVYLSNNPLDIREAINGVEQMSLSLAYQKSIDFEVITRSIKNPYILADELHVNEVIINLISNAIKYTNEGGKVRYNVSQIGSAIDNMVKYRFEVTDTGIGMSEEFQEHLFETFSREENATVSKTEGAGLGLSIVKKIVDLSNGTISVKSTVGEGTKVTVEIPFRVMSYEEIENFLAEKEREKDIFKNELLEGKRVLLVEDNEMNREISTDILNESGLVVETAEDGKIAVKMVNEKGVDYYDYILMDIQMPVMNGYEATMMIRDIPDGDKIPIIALSANAFKEDVEKSLDAGMDAHIAKPIDGKILFNEMRKLSR